MGNAIETGRRRNREKWVEWFLQLIWVSRRLKLHCLPFRSATPQSQFTGTSSYYRFQCHYPLVTYLSTQFLIQFGVPPIQLIQCFSFFILYLKVKMQKKYCELKLLYFQKASFELKSTYLKINLVVVLFFLHIFAFFCFTARWQQF